MNFACFQLAHIDSSLGVLGRRKLENTLGAASLSLSMAHCIDLPSIDRIDSDVAFSNIVVSDRVRLDDPLTEGATWLQCRDSLRWRDAY